MAVEPIFAPEQCVTCPHVQSWCEAAYAQEQNREVMLPHQRRAHEAGHPAAAPSFNYQASIDHYSNGCPGVAETFAVRGGVAVRAIVCMSPQAPIGVQREAVTVRRVAREPELEPEYANE